jgi:hypothetical protein
MYLNEKNYKTYFLITLIIILCYNNELSDYLKKNNNDEYSKKC